MTFAHQGKTYSFETLQSLAEKPNLAANIAESVLKTQDGQFIWLTVVSNQEETNPYGIMSGWYTTQLP